MRLEQGQIISSRYEIIESIGIGGMAIVYRARDLKLNRFVTFKVLKEEFIADEDFVKKFSVEAQAAARLSHPNIVTVYDYGNDENVYYIVMEYIDGFTLKELINKKAPFEDDETLGVAIQIASALEHAHANKIVHRDIKPQNILVTRDGSIKVTDFGIARAATSNTLTVESIGSVHYFSPEQARGVYVDYKSDLYSLGIILFEMATGKLPFEGDNAVQLAMKHMNDPLPSIKGFNSNVSDSLNNIIIRATQKVSTNRYQSAEELNHDLKRALTDESGDFVKRNLCYNDMSPTVIITKEERDEIRALAKFEEPPKNDYYKNSFHSEQDSYDKKTEKKVIIAAIVTAFAIIALVTSIGAYMINKNTQKPMPTPDLSNKTWDEALEIVREMKVYLVKSAEEHSDDIEKEHIISQTPIKNSEINVGESINVVISLGSEKIEVPNVVNKELPDAYDMFADVIVDLAVEYEFDDEVPIGVVIDQDPSAGSMVMPNSKVVLKVSKGQENTKVIVPNVKGMTEASAKAALQSKGLIAGNVIRDTSQTVDEGLVIKQGVNAGETVNRDYIVNLVVSSGKPKTQNTQPPVQKATEAPSSAHSSIEGTTNNSEEEKPIKTEILTIHPNLPEDAESVTVKVIKKSDSSTAEEVYSKVVGRDEFPIKVPVSGNKTAEFQLYIDDKYEGSETKSFE